MKTLITSAVIVAASAGAAFAQVVKIPEIDAGAGVAAAAALAGVVVLLRERFKR